VICAVHQPQYLPWPGYFAKLDAADLFVIYDDTQYKHDEWQNRNRIKTANGAQWLTVPVHHHQADRICDVRIDSTLPWRRKHANALATNYARAPFYAQYADLIAALYQQDWPRLAELNTECIVRLCSALGITTRMVRSSDLDYTGKASDALISICQAVGADAYLSGPGGRNYLNQDAFPAAGIDLLFHDFQPPVYSQPYGEFVPYMSVIDLLLNVGPDSLDLIRSARTITAHDRR